MSHLPFVTIAPDTSDSDVAIDSDSLRAPGDRTATAVSSTSATSNIAAALMPPTTSASSSRVPSALRFPIVALLSLGLSAGLYSVTPEPSGFELATVSRSLNEPWQIGALVAWRVTELFVAWTAGYDYFDFLNFYILYSAPYYALLGLFYEISLASIVFKLVVDTCSSIIPFYLLRAVNAHNVAISKPATPNAALASNTPIRLYVTLFAAAIYAVVVYSSLYTWLPVYLVTHFDSIRTLEYAHNAALPVLLLAFIPLGIAAKDFLFAASIASSRSPAADKLFDPATASLPETLAWNVGLTGWGKREDVVLKRTVLLVLMTAASSTAKIFGTVEGAEEWGAFGWSSVFAVAAALTGIGYAWVGDV